MRSHIATGLACMFMVTVGCHDRGVSPQVSSPDEAISARSHPEAWFAEHIVFRLDDSGGIAVYGDAPVLMSASGHPVAFVVIRDGAIMQVTGSGMDGIYRLSINGQRSAVQVQMIGNIEPGISFIRPAELIGA